ncbi:MAG: 3-deoxy-7-phosphoheptulonate synthase, partial [Polyangiales bacterium]
VQHACQALRDAGLRPGVVVDCSHDNSGKNHENQPKVLYELMGQLEAGSEHVLGVMLESNLKAGRQDLVPGKPLVYGQSITDACIDFEATETLLTALAKVQKGRRRGAR